MQLSLRSLLMAIAVLAFIFALGAWGTEDYRREQSIRNAFLALGADNVRVNIHEGQPSIWLTLNSARTAADLTKYRHQDLSQIGIEGEVSQEMLVPLAQLKNLDFLHFHKCTIDSRGDLKPLRNLKGLKALAFSNSSVSHEAIAELEFVPNLTDVIFHTNDISRDAVENLATSRPKVRIYETDGFSGATNAPRVWPMTKEPTK